MASKFTSFLRSATNDFAQFLRTEGLLTVTPDQESKLAELIERFNDDTYGSTSPQGRRPKSKVQVVSSESVTYNREYLAGLSVQDLLRLGKEKGCKQLSIRKKETLIVNILEHLSKPATEVLEPSSQSSDISSNTEPTVTDDELQPEPAPPVPVQVGTVVTEPVAEKKPRKKREPKAKPEGQEPAKKGRKPKEPKPAAAAEPTHSTSEDEDEVTIAVKSWIHPKEQDKLASDRTKYCIDPVTNYLYNPEQLTDDPIGKWDEETQEIIPL